MNLTEPMIALAAVIGLAANVITHLLSSRLGCGRRQPLALLLGLAAGLCTTAAVAAPLLPWSASAADAVALCVLNLAAYVALAFGYFCFVNLNLTSLRIRLLKELDREQRAEQSLAEIERRYDADQILDRRIQRLVQTGQLVERHGRYFIGRRPSMLLLAQAVGALRYLIFGARNRSEGSTPAARQFQTNEQLSDS